jgi:Cu-Zn family superoxide dismutase
MLTPELMNDEDGSAFIVHAGTDDYASQPSGAAGDRIACGVFGE